METMKTVFRIMAVALIPFTAHFPAVCITLSFVSYVSIKSKLQHPPLATLQTFELLKIGYFKFLLPPLPQAKIAFKCPTQYQTILGVFNKCCGIKQSHGLVFVAAL